MDSTDDQPSPDPSTERGPDGHERTGDDAVAEAIVDQEAAEIDPRDPGAPEQIAELVEDAQDLGLPTPDPSEVAPDSRP